MKQNLSSAKTNRFDLKQAFRQNWFIPLFTMVIFFYVYVMSAQADYETIGDLKVNYYFFGGYAQYGIPISLFTFFGALLSAVTSLYFLSSKKQTNVYLSTTLNRKQLFRNRALVCLILLFFAFLIPLTVDFIWNIQMFGFSNALLSVYLLSLWGYMTFAVVGYAIGAIAVIFTGNVVEAIVGGASLSMLPFLSIYTIRSLVIQFLPGYIGSPRGMSIHAVLYEPSLLRFSYLTPTFFFTSIKQYAFRQTTADVFSSSLREGVVRAPGMDYYVPVLIWFIIGIGLLMLAGNLMKKRKAENAGSLGATKWMNAVVAITGTLGALACISLIGSTKIEGFFIWIAPLVMIAVYLFVQFVLTRNFKKFVKSLIPLPALLLVFGIISGVLATGGLGFTKYVPQAQQVEKAFISMPYNLPFYDNNMRKNAGYSGGIHLYENQYESLIGPFETEKDIEKVLKLHKDLTEVEKGENTPVLVQYYLKDGTAVSRSFYQTTPKVQKELLSLTESDYAKKYLQLIFAGVGKNNYYTDIVEQKEGYQPEFYKINHLAEQQGLYGTALQQLSYEGGETALVSNNHQGSLSLNDLLTEAEFKMMKKCIADDLCDMTYEQRYVKPSVPLAVFTFTQKIEETPENYNSHYSNEPEFNYQPLHPEMKRTIAFLNEKGLLQKITETAKPISALIVDSQSILQKIASIDDAYYNNGSPFSFPYHGEFLDPFFNIIVKGKPEGHLIDAVLEQELSPKGLGRDLELKSVDVDISTERIQQYQHAFKDSKKITDAAQLNMLDEKAYPSYYTKGVPGYYVWMEYPGESTILFVPKENAPDFLK